MHEEFLVMLISGPGGSTVVASYTVAGDIW
jgi:hypothetical protein